MATDPMAVPNLTSGSASDSLKSLLQLLGNRSTALDPGLASLGGVSSSAAGAFQNAINNQNTSMGLSPEALSALRTQGTSGINDQYQSAAQALNSNLLRRGAMGQGQLPGSGGDISRAYQPLYSAMEAAKTKANTDTILADEAAKRQSLYQNQQMALSAANNVFGNSTNLFNAGNAALGQAGGVANAIADLEGPNLLALLGTSLATGAFTGTGPGASLVSGGGTNGTGSYGMLGDALGKIPGLGGGSTGSLSTDDIMRGIANGGFGAVAPFAGSATDQAGQAAASTAAGTADQYSSALKDALGIGASVGVPLATGALTGAGAGTIAAGIGTPSIIGQIGTTAAETSASGGFGSTAMGLLTNPITAAVGAAIIGAVAWVKSQAHWEANTWTRGYQKPFDDKMAQIHEAANQIKASGQMTPEAAAQIQAGAKEALDKYQQDLDTFYREKGLKSDQSRVAAQAYQDFIKYYGQNGEMFLNQLVT